MADYRDTPAELTVLDRGGQVRNVRAYGARPDPAFDSAPAIQELLGALDHGQGVFVPETRFSEFFRIDSGLRLPARQALVLTGAGLRSSRLRAGTRMNAMLASTNTESAVGPQWLVEGVHLDGALLAELGLDLRVNHRGRVLRSYVEGCTDAGIGITDSMIVVLAFNQLDSNRDGIAAQVGRLTGLNGGLVLGNTVENQTRYGIHLVNGAAGTLILGNTLEANRRAAIRAGQDAVMVPVVANYFEENHERGVLGCADLVVGETAMCRAMPVVWNYFNGSAEPGTYRSIRVKYADGLVVRENFVNIGSSLVSFEPGAIVYNSTFGPNFYGPGVDVSDPRTVYAGLPAGFVNGGNRIDEPRVVPLLAGNFIGADWPLASAPNRRESYRWAAYVTGTWAATPHRWRGRRAVRHLARTAGQTAQLQYALPVDAVGNAELRGRYVTFGVPALSDGSAAEGRLGTRIVQEGVAVLGEVMHQPIRAADGWKVYYVSAYVPADMTGTLLLDVHLPFAAGYYLGQPHLYVGVAPIPADRE
ncbi:MAG TPA: right-handed parallel beta-helix repeat-containing protein [Longimicrobiaceae bacterium]|nr:right-handed parallel beta-helix repeat-containing protein [Longimicrobiaceae bacterium]